MAEKFSALSHALPQAPTRRHAAGSGGKMAKTDDPPRINWIGVTANACERLGIRATYVHDNLDRTHGALHHGYYLCLWERVMAHSGRHATDIRRAMTDSRNIPPSA